MTRKKLKKCTRCRRRPIVWRAANGQWYATCCATDIGQETGQRGTREQVEALWNSDVIEREYSNLRRQVHYEESRRNGATT